MFLMCPLPCLNACRLQEQLLEVRARESKLVKEREGLEGQVERLEAQRARLDAELAQMRKMLSETGKRRGVGACWVAFARVCEVHALSPARFLSPLARLQNTSCLLPACLPARPAPPCPALPRPALPRLPCLPSTEARCQASHKQAMEAANEAKRLAPLEPKAARLEDAVHAAHAELERVQREVTAHQSSIRQATPHSPL